MKSAISFNLVGFILLISIFIFNSIHPISSLKANTEEIKEFNLYLIWKDNNKGKYEDLMKHKEIDIVKTKKAFLNSFIEKEIVVKKQDYSYEEILIIEKNIREYKEAVRKEGVIFQYLLNTFIIFILIFLFKKFGN